LILTRRSFIKKSTKVFFAISIFPAGFLTSCKSKKEEYRKLSNNENPSPSEKKHVPGLEIPDNIKQGEPFEVKIKVGYLKEHPSTKAHWITEIKLLSDKREINKISFPKGGQKPQAVFKIQLDKPSVLEAVGICNLHGTWISEPVKAELA